MKFAEIKEMTNEQLIGAFYWVAVQVTKEENSMRGLSKKTAKEETWLLNEMVKRFGLDAVALDKEINPK